MEKIKETQKGFYGCYWPLEGSTCAIIAMLGDDCEDYMAKMAVKWMQKKYGVSMLTLSPGHKDYSHHNLPVERIGAAITYLKERGIKKIAIAGASTTGMYALIAASYYPEITLTIAMTPADFVMEGFYQGKRDGQTEWPGEGESSVSWQGKPLPYLPYAYRHPEYGRKIKEEAKRGKDMIASLDIFRDSESAHPIREEEYIKVEQIKGKLLLIGAKDDVLWDTVSDIREGIHAGMKTVGIVEGSSVLGLSKGEFDALTEKEQREQYERAEKIYKEAGADYVIRDIRGLLDIVK
mgnify:CR=1 FL=1